MCGRMNVSDHEGVQALLDDLALPLPGGFVPHYNVAPTMAVPTVFAEEEGALACAMMEWGLVPPWSKPGELRRPLINARAETVWSKPSFREAARARRALVVANGFYEWRRAGGVREPYYIRPADSGAFAFAALYQISRDGVPQCCVVTTRANETVAGIHDRMPVILAGSDLHRWLGPADRAILDALLVPAPDAAVATQRVSSYVNSSRNDGPRCLEPEPHTRSLF